VATGPGSATPAPGWYDDPAGSGGRRWWDGTTWTAHTQAAPQPPGGGRPPLAPVGARFLALLLDALLIAGVFTLVTLVLALIIGPLAGDNAREAGAAVGRLGSVVILVVYVVYFTLLESGRYGQTIGKSLMGVRVATVDGQRLSRGSALVRVVTRSFPFVGLLAVLWALFEPRRRGLHDLIAGTVVVAAPGPRVPVRELLRGA
jgi:uncharacterized RDD family membrane protein YckC